MDLIFRFVVYILIVTIRIQNFIEFYYVRGFDNIYNIN